MVAILRALECRHHVRREAVELLKNGILGHPDRVVKADFRKAGKSILNIHQFFND